MFYFQFPPMGKEGIFFMSSVAVVLALLSGALSLTLAAYLLLLGKSPKPLNAMLISVLAIAIAVTFVWAI
jgi:hypothetical protein